MNIIYKILLVGLISAILIGTTGSVDVNKIQNIQFDGHTIDQIEATKKVNDHPQSIIDREGKKNKALADKIKNAMPNDKFRVAIWVKSDNITKISKSDIEASIIDQVNKNIKSKIPIVKADMVTVQKSLKTHLNSRNVKILYESRYAPVIFAELTYADIQEIDAREDVILMQLEMQYQKTIANSVSAILAPLVWNYINGGITVAVIESDGIAFANPYLKDGVYFNQTNPKIDYHATAIAGIIGSIHSKYRGVEYKGPAILSANSQEQDDSHLIAATEWAMDNGARVLSNSWTLNGPNYYSFLSNYYDYIVLQPPYPTVVFSAGNCGTMTDNRKIIGSPASAYNVITVGSFDDNNSGWRWSDDVISRFSSYGNPPSNHGDRQKPEVVAVGAHDSRGFADNSCSEYGNSIGLKSTTTAGPTWIGGNRVGTSFSAPEVSGEAALLMNKSAALIIWPEAVRAIIMASADHNIEGNSRISDRDGTGGINVFGAYQIVNKGRGIGWNSGSVSYDLNSPWYGPSVTAIAGQKVRIVFTWNSRSTGPCGPNGCTGTDNLNADLDLYVQRLNGTMWENENRAGYSRSYDNNYEIVEFNAPVSAKYRAKIIKHRWDDEKYSEYYGYAVYVTSPVRNINKGTEYASIQHAINDARPYDEIQVYSGTYYENVNITKPLTLRGIGVNRPTIDTGGNGNAVIFSGGRIIFERFNIKNGRRIFGSGIKLISNNNIIRNNYIFNNEIGIDLSSDNNTLSGNNASNNYIGIGLGSFSSSSNNNILSNNNISSNFQGIDLVSSNNNILTNNNISNNSYGIDLAFSSSNNTMTNNNINSNSNGGIDVSSSDNNILTNNNISNNSYGINLAFSSSNNTMTNNNINSNSNGGIDVFSSNNNILTNNNISNNSYGINLAFSGNGTMTNNNISNNSNGIKIFSSDNNKLTSNNISNNSNGIEISSSDNNTIYHNNVINNVNQAFDNSINIWDNNYPDGGNYWRDYTGKDTNNDGIGDIPYNIPGGNNKDRFPLMHPYYRNI